MDSSQAAAKLASLSTVYIAAAIQEAQFSMKGSQVLNQLCDLRDRGFITQRELDDTVAAAHDAACEILHNHLGI